MKLSLSRSLVIIGAGGQGRVIADTAEALGYSDISFVDNRWPELKKNLVWPVLASELPEAKRGQDCFVAVGNNRKRLELVELLLLRGCSIPTLIHPSAHVSSHVNLDVATFVAPKACLCVGAKLGKAVVINTGATVDHDCVLGEGVHVSPGAHLAGGVIVGNCTWIGIGSSVRELTKIGSDVLVGAGACVVSEIVNGAIVVGVPAKEKK
jgi:sugar O-acyltransferase (sialic acid O-acetyltransferase NeuD family)